MRTRLGNHTLTNLYLAGGAFALGLTAQRYFGGLTPASTPMDGLVFYAAAAGLFIVALLRTPRPLRLPLSLQPRGLASGPVQHAMALGLVLFSGAAILTSLDLFGSGIESETAWFLYLAAIILFIAAAYALRPVVGGWLHSQERDTQARLSRWEWVALALVIVVAIVFRVYRFTDLPYGLWYDEADNGLAARQILGDPNRRPLYIPSTNLPAHFLYVVALSFRLLGDSMYAIRAVAVAFGVGTVIAAYFCGRELFGVQRGRTLGLILAFLIAVSRWDVNWSRIGMHGVTLPFFELWTMAALLRGLRTGKPTCFAWTGVAMGLGLCFYSPFRIFPAIVSAFFLAWFGHWLTGVQRENPVRIRDVLYTWLVPGLLVIMGTLIAVAPVAQFALRHPDLFWDRTKRISVFTDPTVQAHPVAALLASTSEHLLMFNYRGDPNGRHNLPGAPMLDQLSGVLLVLGLLICIVHWDRPRSMLLLLWLLVPLVGGILSTWFEAPQSLRSFGALPAAYALACLPMEWLAEEWQRVFPRARSARATRRFPRGPLATLAIALLVAVGIENAVVYFDYWANDFASWAAFNPAETHMAQDIARYQERYDLRFDPLLTAHLATRYLAPDYKMYHHFDPATVFPIADTSKDGVMLFIAPDSRAIRDQASTLYPDAIGEAFVHSSGNAVLHTLRFTRETIEAVQGLDARYVPTEAGSVGFVRTDPRIDFAWDEDPPLSVPFQVNWTGGMLASTYGTYILQVDAPGTCYLALDGRALMDGPGVQRREIVMAQGVHALYLDCTVTQAGTVRLSWQWPGSKALEPIPPYALYRTSWPINGLVGRFYANRTGIGVPELVRVDRQIAYYFHFLLLPRPYTVQWTGRLFAPAEGTYKLALKAISSASLTLDGKMLIEPSSPGEFREAEVYLGMGLHDIEMRYLDDQSHSQVTLYWQPPDGDVVRVPPEMLFLPHDGAWWPAP